MKDWKGNEIQVGHTVLVVMTRSMFSGGTLSTFFKDKFGNTELIELGTVKNDYLFETVSKAKVAEYKETLTWSEEGDPIDLGEIPINWLGFVLPTNGRTIICIEGISDNQEDYYLDYFNSPKKVS